MKVRFTALSGEDVGIEFHGKDLLIKTPSSNPGLNVCDFIYWMAHEMIQYLF
jgi:hypothetical protein